MHSGVTGEPASVDGCAASRSSKRSLRHDARASEHDPRRWGSRRTVSRPTPPPSSTARRASGTPGCRHRARAPRPTAARSTRKFHIIQPVVVKKNMRSPGCMSKLKCRSSSCSSRMPPWPCTIGFGSPVVPEENSDPQRMIERHLLVLELRRAAPAGAPAACARAPRRGSGRALSSGLQVGQVDDVLERGQARDDCRTSLRRSKDLPP